MIEFSAVTYSYPPAGTDVIALNGVTFTLAPGEHVVVLGPNGSGKSTLVRLANGLLHPSSGHVIVDGLDTADPAHLWDVRARVGMVFQNPDNQIVATTVEEDVAFGPENLGVPAPEIRRRVDNALAAVGLVGAEKREPHQLSGGQKQRLAIAGALALEPAYLVLDEPTSMLDLQGRRDVLVAVQGQLAAGKGVLHVTHHLADAATADRVLVLEGGRVVFDGPPAEILAAGERLASLGLAVPPVGQLAAELRALGVQVPATAMSPESIAASL